MIPGPDQTRPIPQLPPPTRRGGAHRRPGGGWGGRGIRGIRGVGGNGRAGLLAAVAAGGLLVALLVGTGMSGTDQATSVAQPSPGVITRTVTAPAPVTVAPAAVAGSTGSTAGPFTSGIYQVGAQIRPGNYVSTGGSGCYWARLSANDGAWASIITNNLVAGPTSMSVKSSDKYVEFNGDCTWRRK